MSRKQCKDCGKMSIDVFPRYDGVKFCLCGKQLFDKYDPKTNSYSWWPDQIKNKNKSLKNEN